MAVRALSILTSSPAMEFTENSIKTQENISKKWNPKGATVFILLCSSYEISN
jgi:hypothetical protein